MTVACREAPTANGSDWTIPDDALLLLVVLNRREIFACERKVQSRRTFVSVCSPERTFFTLKFGKLLVGCSREMLAGRF